MDPKERPRLHARDHLPGGPDPIDFAAVQPHTGYQQHILDNMPDEGGYWPHDDTDTAFMADIGPNSQNGIYVNDPTLQVAPLVADGKAVALHGASSTYATVAGSSRLVGPAGSWTVGRWIQTTQTTVYDDIVENRAHLITADDNSRRYLQFRMIPATGLLEAICFDSSGSHSYMVTSVTAVNDGVRHLVAARYDASTDELSVWIDGVKDAFGTGPVTDGFTPAVSIPDLHFGVRLVGATLEGYLDAVIDETFLYGDAADDTFMSGLYVLGFDTNISGSKWYFGTGAPATSLGNNGDFYEDTSTGDIYQKVSGSWGSPIANAVGDGTITTIKVADGSITADKLEADPTGNNGKWLRLSSGALAWEAISADEVSIADAGSYFTSADVEGALQELGADVGGGVTADDVSITDSGGYFTSTDVEGALQELGAEAGGGGGGGGGDATVDITSPAHGFSEGDVIRFDPSSIGGTPTMVASHQTAAVASTSITATIPAGLSAGDVLVLKVDWSGMTGVSAVTCTGFTSIGLQGFDLDGVAVLYRLLDGSESYITGGGTVSVVASFGSDFGAHMAVFAIGYSGCSPTSPIDTGVLDGSTSPTNNGYTSTYTTVDDDEVIVQALMIGDSGTIGSWLPASGTLQQDSTSVLSSKHVSYYESDLIGTAGSQAVQALWSTAEFGLVKFGLRPHAGGTGYVLAQADNADDAEVLGIVTAVPDADHFTVTLAGHVTTGLSGLTTGTVYFLDPDTAGALTATEPSTTGEVSKPLLIADSSSSGYFFNFRGEIIGGGSNSGSSFAGPTDAAVTADDVSITDSGGYFTSTDVEGALQELGADAGGSSSQSYAVIEHQTAASVNAGTTVSGTWVTRPLTTEVSDPDGIVSISSNQFTLQPGTYRIEAWSVCYAGDRHKCRIRNITDGVTAIVGSTMYAYSGASGWNKSEADGVIVIAAAKTFELQHYNQTGHGSFGLGYAASVNDGEVEVWAAVKITKTA